MQNEQAKYGSLVFFNKHLEADDVVALLTRHITETCAKKYGFNSNIYIIASDRDYIQLCNNKIHLYDIGRKPISTILLGKYEQDLGMPITPTDYLLIKILTGDTADNVPGCILTEEFISKYMPPDSPKKATPVTKTSTALIKKLFTTAKCRDKLHELLQSANTYLATMPEPEYEEDAAGPDSEPINSIVLPSSHESAKYFKGNQFLINVRTIDFNNIPKFLASEITGFMEQYI